MDVKDNNKFRIADLTKEELEQIKTLEKQLNDKYYIIAYKK